MLSVDTDLREKDQIRIGRDPDWADVVLPESLANASRHHCIVRIGPGCLEIDTNQGKPVFNDGIRLFDGDNLGTHCKLSFTSANDLLVWEFAYIHTGSAAETVFQAVKPESKVRPEIKKALVITVVTCIAAVVALWKVMESPEQNVVTLDWQTRSVFSVQLDRDGEFVPVGTAWLAPGRQVITNRHVAQKHIEAALQLHKPAIIRIPSDNPATPALSVAITGIRYHPAEQQFFDYLSTIPAIETGSNLLVLKPYDIAILETETIPETIKPLQLATAEQALSLTRGEPLAIVGYPIKNRATEWRVDKPTAVIADVKFYGYAGFEHQDLAENISPFIRYDNETTYGNSGSPVLMKDGLVVGIHFSGSDAVIEDQESPLRTRSVGNSYGQSLLLLQDILLPNSTTDEQRRQLWRKWTEYLPSQHDATVAQLDQRMPTTYHRCVAEVILPWQQAKSSPHNPNNRRINSYAIDTTHAGTYLVVAEEFDNTQCATLELASGCPEVRIHDSYTTLAQSNTNRIVTLHTDLDGSEESTLKISARKKSAEGYLRISSYRWSDLACDGNNYKDRSNAK